MKGLKGKFVKVVTMGTSFDSVLIFMLHCSELEEKPCKCHGCWGRDSGRNPFSYTNESLCHLGMPYGSHWRGLLWKMYRQVRNVDKNLAHSAFSQEETPKTLNFLMPFHLYIFALFFCYLNSTNLLAMHLEQVIWPFCACLPCKIKVLLEQIRRLDNTRKILKTVPSIC